MIPIHPSGSKLNRFFEKRRFDTCSPGSPANGVDRMGWTHFLTAEAGNAAFWADDRLVRHNADDAFWARFSTFAATDAFVCHHCGKRALAAKKMMEEAIHREEPLAFSYGIRQ